jgi:ATP-binding cassette subfamily B protein/subfamily B ATP-binding cassette protein MsbA
MHYYWRAIRIAFRFRGALVGTVACSLMVAVFWGANIGALYPVLQIAFSNQSLQSWIDTRIEHSEGLIDRHVHEIEGLRNPGDDSDPNQHVERAGRIAFLEREILTERRSLQTSRRLRPWIHRYLPRDPFQTVLLIVLGLLLATVAKGLFMFGNFMCVASIQHRVTYELRRQFYHQALRLDLHAFAHERTSGMLSHFNSDIGYLTDGIRNIFGCALREPLKMLACLIGASFISWQLLLFSLVLTPFVGFLIRKLAGSMKRANRRVLEEINQLYGVLSETFNGIQTVQAYTLEQSERNKFYRVSKEWLRKAMRIAFYGALTKPATEVMGIGVISLALLAGAYLTLNQQTHLFGLRMCDRPLDTPSLLIFYGMLIGLTEPARKLSEVFNSIQGGMAAAERLFPLLDQHPRIVSPERPTELPERHKNVSFHAVHFSYVPGVPVLSDISLNIEFGETIAIVGPNGCGKSTLIQMLPRFFDPIDGVIRIDGIDLREVRLRDLRRRIGMVTQRAHLFDDTVYNNIASGKANATKEEVVRAAQQARAHRFIIDKLSDGYDTAVGPGGSRLSGGQRQRVALARAIIRDPEILILDEATSQIDLESEQLIQQALGEFARQRTVVLVTHRLATLDLADRILVMNAGKIEDGGTHDELIHRCPLYQRLYALQFQKSA